MDQRHWLRYHGLGLNAKLATRSLYEAILSQFGATFALWHRTGEHFSLSYVGEKVETLVPFPLQPGQQENSLAPEHPIRRALETNRAVATQELHAEPVPISSREVMVLLSAAKQPAPTADADRRAPTQHEEISAEFRSDHNGTLVSHNGSFTRLLQIADGVNGRLTLHRFFPSESAYAGFFQLLRTKHRLRDYELELKTRTGKRVRVRGNFSGYFRRDDPNQGILGSFVDISRERDLANQLQKMRQLDVVGNMAGGIAHDFNNLFTIVLSQCELVRRKVANDDVIASKIDAIREAANAAVHLNRQLLAFTQGGRPQQTELSIVEVVTQLREALSSLVGGNIELKVNCAPVTDKVVAEQSQVEQVVLNLATNARDAMPDGGVLQLDVENLAVDPHNGDSYGQLDGGNYVALRISDTGIGMDLATQQHIFEPFFTTKGDEGTGLGLSTVYGVVRSAGGEVLVHSQPGQGSVFEVLFPSASASVSKERPHSTSLLAH